MEDEDIAFVLAVAEAPGEICQVAADDRRQAGIDDRRAEALVLEDLGQDLVGGADEDARRLLLHDRLHARLVLAVHVGIDERDRDRFVAALLDPSRHGTGSFLVEFSENRTGVVDPLGNLVTVAAADVWRGNIAVGVPEVRLGAAANLVDVAEPLAGDDGGAGQAPRDQRIGADGRAMGEEGHVARLDVRLLQRRHDGRGRIGRIEAVLAMATLPDSSSWTIRSVKVPPTSTATR